MEVVKVKKITPPAIVQVACPYRIPHLRLRSCSRRFVEPKSSQDGCCPEYPDLQERPPRIEPWWPWFCVL